MSIKNLSKKQWLLGLVVLSGCSIVYLIYYGSQKKVANPPASPSSTIAPTGIPGLADLPAPNEKYVLSHSSIPYLVGGLYWSTPSPIIKSVNQLIDINKEKVLTALPANSRLVTIPNTQYVTFVVGEELRGFDPAANTITKLDPHYLDNNIYASNFQVLAQIVSKSLVFLKTQKIIDLQDNPIQALPSFDNNFVAVLMPKEISIFSASTMTQVANFPTSLDASNLIFTWSPKGNLFLIEKVHSPRETSYVYKIDMRTRSKLFLSDTLPLPGGVSAKIVPAASMNDDLMFADNRGGLWILSTTLVGPARPESSHDD